MFEGMRQQTLLLPMYRGAHPTVIEGPVRYWVKGYDHLVSGSMAHRDTRIGMPPLRSSTTRETGKFDLAGAWTGVQIRG